MSGYESPEKALKYVGDEFNYWSGKLTDSSVQLCYALIGANWVVFKSVADIQKSRCAEWSLTVVMLTLALNVITSWLASENMRLRYEYAECDTDRWEKEFHAEKGKRSAWPFTAFGERLGKATRLIKFLLPLVSGFLLIIGAWLKK